MKRFRRDEGVTLVEMVVTTSLIGVVSALMLSGLTDVIKVMTLADDNNRGLFDAKVVLDRLSEDVRQASAVVCDGGPAQVDDSSTVDPSCTSHLQLWIDYDSDYAQDSDEIVTWRLARSQDGEHFDVIRYRGTDTQGRTEATSLIVRTLFTYCADICPTSSPGVTIPPEDARLVNLRMEYDALVGRGTDVKIAEVSVRLRNRVS